MRKVNVLTIFSTVLLLVASTVSASTVFSANPSGGIYGFEYDLSGFTTLATGYGNNSKDLAVGNDSLYFSNGQYIFQCNLSAGILGNTFDGGFATVAAGQDGYVYTANTTGGLYRFNADLTGFTQLSTGWGNGDKDLAVSASSIYYSNGAGQIVQFDLNGGLLSYTFNGAFTSVAVGDDGYVYTASSSGGLYRFNADLTGFTQLSVGWGAGAKDLAVTADSIYFTNGAGSVVQCDLNGGLLSYTFNGGFDTVAALPVPEPATMSLIGFGCVIGLIRRRK